MKKLILVLIVFSLVGFGCVSKDASLGKMEGQSNADSSAEQAIRQLCLNYAKGMSDRDADLILNMFVEDGSYITRINGANNIVSKKKYAQLCPGKFVGWDKIGLQAKAIVQTITVNGDAADGNMVMRFTGPGWSSAEAYVMKFEKRDGQWIIVQIHDK